MHMVHVDVRRVAACEHDSEICFNKRQKLCWNELCDRQLPEGFTSVM
jgi:hypothetical protein